MFTITDSDDRIVYASPNITKILNYSVHEIIGKPFADLLHPEDRPYYLFIAEQAGRHKGQLFQQSSRMLAKNGDERWTEGTIVNLTDIPAVGGTVTNFRDITEKVHTQRELDHSRYILEKANEVTRIGYWVIDLKSPERSLSWSPQLFNIFGVQESGFTGEPSFSDPLMHPADKPGRDARLNRALERPGKYSLDYRIIRPDNQLMWVHEQAEVFFEGEKAAFVVGVVQDITERKVSEQRIRESKHNLDALINNTTDFMWSCDQNLRLISGNTAFYNQVHSQYGVELKEGDPVILLSETHPVMAPWKVGYQTALSGKQDVFETESGKPGARTFLQNTLNPIWDNGKVVGVAGFSRNITDAKKHENHIKAINERFEILSKATNDAVWDLDITTNVITWNHGLRSIYGHEPDNRQTTFRWWEEMVHPDDLNFVIESIRQSFVNKDQLWTCSYRFRCASGTYRYSLDRGFIMYDAGKPVRMIGAQQDIHELTEYRMLLEQKVAERTIELQDALEKEKNLSEMKSRFVSIASHEFRTPLSTIQFATDFLVRYKHKLGEPDIDRKLASISSQVKHMLFLLDDVLTVSKGEAGKIQVQLSSVNIRELVLELARNMENGPGCVHKIGVRLQLTDEVIYSDEKLLLNILTNLISNAIKFSPGEKLIGMYCGQDAGKLILEVADNGIGINEQETDTIFEPFSRGKDVGAISGTGLGLSIVRTAVKLFKGKIELTRNENFKTVFRVEIPIGNSQKV
jgi:PAS domain S-box-containing protein